MRSKNSTACNTIISRVNVFTLAGRRQDMTWHKYFDFSHFLAT